MLAQLQNKIDQVYMGDFIEVQLSSLLLSFNNNMKTSVHNIVLSRSQL